MKFKVVDATAEGDEVKVHWSATATQTAEFLGIPPRNKFASIQGTSIYRIEGGKIAENWMKWDVMSLMAQLVGAVAARHADHWRERGEGIGCARAVPVSQGREMVQSVLERGTRF